MFSKYNAIDMLNKNNFDINELNKLLNIDTNYINIIKQSIEICNQTNNDSNDNDNDNDNDINMVTNKQDDFIHS